MQLNNNINITSNVVLTLREKGVIYQQEEYHNIFTNIGRLWIRDAITAKSYPAPATASDVDLKDYGNGKRYLPRFIGLGVGGVLQALTPPGPGSYTEVVTVKGLEYPTPVSGAVGARVYLAEVIEQDLAVNDPSIFPVSSPYGVRYRKVFSESEISYDGASAYLNSTTNQLFGTEVPITEMGLFTSAAYPLTAPAVDAFIGGYALGFIAYNIISPIVKTPAFTLEVAWELRF